MTNQELYILLKNEFNKSIDQNEILLELIDTRHAMNFGFDNCFQVMIKIMEESEKNKTER